MDVNLLVHSFQVCSFRSVSRTEFDRPKAWEVGSARFVRSGHLFISNYREFKTFSEDETISSHLSKFRFYGPTYFVSKVVFKGKEVFTVVCNCKCCRANSFSSTYL